MTRRNVAYPPGSILHIKIDQQAKPLCLGYFYPNKLSVETISNDKLCMLEIDRGMFDDHLPTAVLNALKRCQRDNTEIVETGDGAASVACLETTGSLASYLVLVYSP